MNEHPTQSPLAMLAAQTAPPTPDPRERGEDPEQPSRVAHAIALGAEGLPPRDYQCLARAYLALRARALPDRTAEREAARKAWNAAGDWWQTDGGGLSPAQARSRYLAAEFGGNPARAHRAAIYSRQRGYVGTHQLAVGDRVEWHRTDFGMPRAHDRYQGTVIKLTAKRVRVTFDVGGGGSLWDPEAEARVLLEQPFTICVSASRLIVDADVYVPQVAA